ncbi:MAG: hypothetical protein MJ078_02330, partial [Clostridia bacterium]|nr:hypothetical protein [Clostridia bacterium]
MLFWGTTLDGLQMGLCFAVLALGLYISFFPQLVAGPIVTHDKLVPQFQDVARKSVNWENMGKGLLIFSIGLTKKVIIADVFGNAANYGYANIDVLSTVDAL